MIRRDWSAEEDAYVRRHYGARSPEPLPMDAMVLHLRRNRKSVLNHAFYLGLADPRNRYNAATAEAARRKRKATDAERRKREAAALGCDLPDPAAARVLAALGCYGRTAGEVAAEVGLTPAYVAAALKRLRAAGAVSVHGRHRLWYPRRLRLGREVEAILRVR